MTFKPGDFVKPKKEWTEAPTSQGKGVGLAVVPTGKVMKIEPWGKGQILYVEGDMRPFVSGVFDLDEKPKAEPSATQAET